MNSSLDFYPMNRKIHFFILENKNILKCIKIVDSKELDSLSPKYKLKIIYANV